MPGRQPFTALCRAAACTRSSLSRYSAVDRLGERADLHMHTTCSDGSYTPAQAVEIALRTGLASIAITDHDTLAGIESSRSAAAGTRLEIIAGVEITAEYCGQELHLLGYFVRL